MKKSNSNFKSMAFFFIAIIMSFIATSCDENNNDSPEPNPELDLSMYQVAINSVTDIGEARNASDIQVTFKAGAEKSSITEYQIVLSKDASQLSVETIQGLTTDRITSINADESKDSYRVTLLGSQKDLVGEVIENDINYSIGILTIGTFNGEEVFALSTSKPFALTKDLLVSTLSQNVGANDGIAVDREGNIFIANYGGYDPSTFTGTGKEVVKVTPDGNHSVFTSGLVGPAGSAFNNKGDLFVTSGSNYAKGEIIKIDADGNEQKVATINGYPSGILPNSDGSLLVANYWLPVIHKISASGDITLFARDSRLKGAVGIVYDDNNNAIVGNRDTGDILSVNQEGSVSHIATVPRLAPRAGVVGYITYFDGNIYATNAGADRIYRVSLDGDVSGFAGNGVERSVNGKLSKASFNNPNGIAVDKDKNVLYVSCRDGSLRVIELE